MTLSSPAPERQRPQTNSTSEHQLRLINCDEARLQKLSSSINFSDGTDVLSLLRTLLRSFDYLRERAQREPSAWVDSGSVFISRVSEGVYRICSSIASSESAVGFLAQGAVRPAPSMTSIEKNAWPTPSEDAFDRMASSTPKDLVRWIRSDVLTQGHLTLAAESLGSAQDDEVIPTLLDLLDSDSPLVREGAVFGLGRIGGAHVVSRLQDVARLDSSKNVRASACDVLDQLDDC